MKAFILLPHQARRYAFIRTAISIVLVTAGLVSETGLGVWLSPHVLTCNTSIAAQGAGRYMVAIRNWFTHLNVLRAFSYWDGVFCITCLAFFKWASAVLISKPPLWRKGIRCVKAPDIHKPQLAFCLLLCVYRMKLPWSALEADPALISIG